MVRHGPCPVYTHALPSGTPPPGVRAVKASFPRPFSNLGHRATPLVEGFTAVTGRHRPLSGPAEPSGVCRKRTCRPFPISFQLLRSQNRPQMGSFSQISVTRNQIHDCPDGVLPAAYSYWEDCWARSARKNQNNERPKPTRLLLSTSVSEGKPRLGGGARAGMQAGWAGVEVSQACGRC